MKREIVPKSGAATDWPLILICAAYVFCAVTCVSHSALWMDELLAVTAATQAHWRGVVHVIWVGTDFSPPTFHLLLHALPGLSSHERLVARLPSIVAVLGAGWCVAVIVLRRYPAPIATIAFAATVASPLFGYAVQARQYGLTTFCLAAALAVWDGMPDSPKQTPARMIALWAALAACLSLHFYGVVVVGALVVCEILWSAHSRKVRVHVWATFAALIPVLLAWLPLSIHLRAIGRADQIGPEFYAAPTPVRLGLAILDLTIGNARQLPLFAGLLLAIILGAVLNPNAGMAQKSRPVVQLPDPNFLIIMLGLVAIPFGAYELGAIATGSFVTRYAAGLTLLPGLMISAALATCPDPKRAAIIFVPLAAFSLFLQSGGSMRTHVLTQVREVLDQNLAQPVLVGDGGLYIELVGFLSPADADHVAYLAAPREAPSADPTNEHEVIRLASIDPRFHVVPFEQAMSRPAGFAFLRVRTEDNDVAFLEFLHRRIPTRLVAETESIEAFQVQPVPMGHTQ